MDDRWTSSNDMNSNEMMEDIKLRKHKVPALACFDIPLYVEVLQLFLQEIIFLSNLFVEKSLCSSIIGKVKRCTWSNFQYFSTEKASQRWIKKWFIDYPPYQIADTGTSDLCESGVAGWIMKRLA